MLYVCLRVYSHGLHTFRRLYIRQLADTYAQWLVMSEKIRLQELSSNHIQ